MTLEEVIRFAKEQGYDSAVPLDPWRGFDVYEPVFEGEGVPRVGLPLVILVKGNAVRMSTPKEAFALIDVS